MSIHNVADPTCELHQDWPTTPNPAVHCPTCRPAADACHACGHDHTPDGCSGPPTPSDVWAGVSPAVCDCDAQGGVA